MQSFYISRTLVRRVTSVTSDSDSDSNRKKCDTATISKDMV